MMTGHKDIRVVVGFDQSAGKSLEWSRMRKLIWRLLIGSHDFLKGLSFNVSRGGYPEMYTTLVVYQRVGFQKR